VDRFGGFAILFRMTDPVRESEPTDEERDDEHDNHGRKDTSRYMTSRLHSSKGGDLEQDKLDFGLRVTSSESETTPSSLSEEAEERRNYLRRFRGHRVLPAHPPAD
jgi:hypothetical protein